MKKAISLMEILVSIVIFSFIALTLYKTMDLSKNDINKSNLLIENIDFENHIKGILIEDFLESNKVTLDELRNNSFVKLTSYNTLHNPLYTNISYILDENNDLYRIESLEPISKENINEIEIKSVYIDLVFKNVEKFRIEKGKEMNYFIYIKTFDKTEFSLLIPYTLK